VESRENMGNLSHKIISWWWKRPWSMTDSQEITSVLFIKSQSIAWNSIPTFSI